MSPCPWSLRELGCRYGCALPGFAEPFFQLPGSGKEEDGGQSNTINVKDSAHLNKY